jgi:hypothetical protein
MFSLWKIISKNSKKSQSGGSFVKLALVGCFYSWCFVFWNILILQRNNRLKSVLRNEIKKG